jgi:P2 family phage major capsid protein
MDPNTVIRFERYAANVAQLNGVASTVRTFAVAPSVEQKFEEKLKETIEFLGSINLETVGPQTGQTLGLETTRPIMGTKDTSGGARRDPSDPTDNAETNEYMCVQTNFDWSRRYDKLDAWKHKPEFETLLSMTILKQRGRDLIMCGWHGIARAATSNVVANPLLQDVAEGWLFKIGAKAPAQVFDDGALTVNPTKAIYIAAGVELVNSAGTNTATADADYSSLDALVLDAKRLLPEWHRGDNGLVVIVGHDLVDEKYFQIAQETGATATEVEATDRILRSTKQLGGLNAIKVPYFPANQLLITRLDNLSIYNQEGTTRRRLVDEPEYDRIANYESVNLDYVVEDYELVVHVKNIVLGAKP